MSIFKMRTRKQLIHIVKKLKFIYRVNKIRNLTYVEYKNMN